MKGMSNITEKVMIPNDSKSVVESPKAEITQDIQTVKSEQRTHPINMRKDAYINSGEQEVSGIYNIGKNKDGKTIIKYNDPDKKRTGDFVSSASSSSLEIKRDSLKMKIRTETDETKRKELKKKLRDIERQMKKSKK